jgi:hypothetical protein
MPLYVYKVIAYPIHDDDTLPDIDLTNSFLKGENIYEGRELCGIDLYRIEYRFLWNETKYRYIDHGSKQFPNFYQLSHKVPFKKKIFYAGLNMTDVTEHVNKYAGPNGDFYKETYDWTWMFPNERFAQEEDDELDLMYTDMKVCVLSKNEAIKDKLV